MKVAVVGAGIAGMGCAWALSKEHQVVLFEKQARIGGHSRTLDVPVGGADSGSKPADNKKVPVDTGFIVFNRPNYPNLVALFYYLGVPFVKSAMSFGVSLNRGEFEYGTGGIKGFLGQLSNLFNPDFWSMFLDILKFNRSAMKTVDDSMTLENLLDEMQLGEDFRDYYLLPMAASIWSTPTERMLGYPAKTFLNFFENHGLLTLFDQPQWYTVEGGSREYVERLMADFDGEVKVSAGITKVERSGGQVSLTFADNDTEIFDQVVFACHADQASGLIGDLDAKEKDLLSKFCFQQNQVFTHTDTQYMPSRRQCWSSWVYLESGDSSGSDGTSGPGREISLSYWMNNLQPLDTEVPVIVTLNPDKQPGDDTLVDAWTTEHPLFDQQAIDAQQNLESIQGYRNTFYCGAWTGYGFHEDGLRSGLDVAEKLGAEIPWRSR